MALTDTERAIRLEGAMQALEVMLRPGAGQATATVAHAVVLGWMEQDGVPIAGAGLNNIEGDGSDRQRET